MVEIKKKDSWTIGVTVHWEIKYTPHQTWGIGF